MTVSFRSKCALACMFLFYSTAHTSAVTKSWIGGSDNWSNNANWNPFGAPANSDTANIVFGDGVSRTIDYDYVESPFSLNALNLDLSGSINIQGALALAIVNGGDDFPLPTLGGQFTLLSAPGGVTSSIENAISLRSVARGSRVDESVTSNGNDAVLQAVAITPLMDGDFNGDGSINAADYIV